MRTLFFSSLAVIYLSLTACTSVLNNLPGVYTLDIQQGNVVDQDMIDQLRPNMSKRQVLYIMGSPMLVDVFHQKRWDYLYSKQVGGEGREQKRVSLYFEGDTLKGIQGDFRPDSQAVKSVKETTVEVPPRDLDKTLWEMITGLFSDEPVRKAVEEKTEAAKNSPESDKNSEKADDKPSAEQQNPAESEK